MIEHLYEDLSVHLYEGEPITKKTPTPPPIIYLTQWKIVGNSEVHTDEYLTQWKVEGNSVVDNNTILSCGDLGQDGKYHVKISNGATIYDIPLTEPLRKVNNVADSIEFANGTAVVTRYYKRIEWQTILISKITTSGGVIYFALAPVTPYNMGYTENQLSNAYPNYKRNSVSAFNGFGMGLGGSKTAPIIRVVNSEIENMTESEFAAANTAAGIEIIYELATPTTETIQVPQIQKADSYSCVISQGGKAVEWSSFETND